MNFLRKVFTKKPEKVDHLAVVLNITVQLRMTYPFHNEENIIQKLIRSYPGLDDATARRLFKETLEGLKDSGGLKG